MVAPASDPTRVFAEVIKLAIGLGLALVLNEQLPGRGFFRGMVLLPWAMPSFVAYVTFKMLYSPTGGGFDLILGDLGLISQPINFLSSQLALPSVLVATVWRGFPFWVISFLAALQTVPVALNELIIGDVFLWGPIMAGSVVSAIPVMVLYFASQRLVVQGLAAGAVKG